LLRVSDAGRSQRCGLHRGRRPKPSTGAVVRPLENCLPRKIERKARLATFNIVHEFLQSIRAALAFQRSQWQGGLRGRGCQKVAQTLKQCSLIFTSRDHRQATFWSLLAEVLEEPAVT
jgi:hypothetical protein